MKRAQLFVVLGMHRSGTSAITRALELFGIGLGSNLQPAGFDNPKGFWEDRDCLKINEDLLSHLGSAYDQLGLPITQLKEDAYISKLKSKAAQMISRKLEENGNSWGFKDPRTCRLLPFWQEIFKSTGYDIAYIIALRNPLSVAASLERRNQISRDKSYLLWLQHVLPAVLETRNTSRLIVDFDLLIESPISQLRRIASKFDLTPPNPDSDTFKSYVDDFLDLKLRHSQFSIEALKLDHHVPSDMIKIYQLLRSTAEDITDPRGDVFNSEIERFYDRLMAYLPAFEYATSLERSLVSLHQTAAQFQSEIASLHEKLRASHNEFQAAILGKQQELALQGEYINEFRADIASKQKLIDDDQKYIFELKGKLDRIPAWLRKYL